MSTPRDTSHPRPDQDEEMSSTPTSDTSPPPRLELSLTQVVGGSLAAATAAALGSRLGVVGTISGAALVSVVASVASALYTTSLRRTSARLATVLDPVRDEPSIRHREHAPTRVRRVVLGAALVFVLAVAGVTVGEMVSGRSLQGDQGGTTVASTLHPSTSTGSGTDGTTRRTPAGSPSTGASPSADPSADPSEGGTATPSASPTASPSASPRGPDEVGQPERRPDRRGHVRRERPGRPVGIAPRTAGTTDPAADAAPTSSPTPTPTPTPAG